jgi:FAD/FMN-containing dehydrogenase
MTNSIGRREFLGSAAFLLGSAIAGRKATARERTEHLTLKTLDGGAAAIDSAAITELKTGLKGELLIYGAPENALEYEGARKIWNAAIDRHPAIIIRCVDAGDIVRAVRFAKRHNALLSVRGGGHNHVGFAVCDAGVMIDLAPLGTVEVDADRQLATAGGGTTFGTYDMATYQKGLASTGPIISMVGIGGYTLGGGIGWLHRKLGAGCDSLVSAEMVTADGDVITLSETVNSDLFWAIRGGGGNFGVVSNLKFRLAPLKDVLAGLVFHPLEDLPKIATFVREFNATAPDELGLWLTMRKAPASPALPSEMHGRPVATIALCYAGADETAEKVLKPVRQFGRPLIDLVKARPYPDWQKALDPAWENGFHNQWVGHYLPELTDAAAQTLVEYVSKVTSPFTDVKLATLGGAMARVGEDATAFSHRDAKYALVIQARWKNASESAQNLAWTQDFFDAMKAHSTGTVYVNFIADEGERRVADAYNAPAFQRLRNIKRKYDPENLFRMNQNIRPA